MINFIMKKSIYILSVIALLGLQIPSALAATFNDVPTSDGDYDEIYDINGRGIASGYGNGTFGPNREVTRAEATKFIVNTVGFDCSNYANTEPSYTDTGGAFGLKLFIACFEAKGFISGYGDGRFGPQDSVLGPEFFKMLFNASGVTVDMAYPPVFADLQDPTLTPFMRYAMAYGIYPAPGMTDVIGNNRLKRREVARYIYNFIAATEQYGLAGSYVIPSLSTVNWQLYTSTDYGYTLKYPADWIYSEVIDLQGVTDQEIIFSKQGNHLKFFTVTHPIKEIGYEASQLIDTQSWETDGVTITKKTYQNTTTDFFYLVTWNVDNWEQSGQIVINFSDFKDSQVPMFNAVLESISFDTNSG